MCFSFPCTESSGVDFELIFDYFTEACPFSSHYKHFIPSVLIVFVFLYILNSTFYNTKSNLKLCKIRVFKFL